MVCGGMSKSQRNKGAIESVGFVMLTEPSLQRAAIGD
jgi:hypothetical protein